MVVNRGVTACCHVFPLALRFKLLMLSPKTAVGLPEKWRDSSELMVPIIWKMAASLSSLGIIGVSQRSASLTRNDCNRQMESNFFR